MRILGWQVSKISLKLYSLFKLDLKTSHLEFNIQRSSPNGSVMTLDNVGVGYTPVMQASGYDKFGANSPLLRVGTTITSSTNISSAAPSQG